MALGLLCKLYNNILQAHISPLVAVLCITDSLTKVAGFYIPLHHNSSDFIVLLNKVLIHYEPFGQASHLLLKKATPPRT